MRVPRNSRGSRSTLVAAIVLTATACTGTATPADVTPTTTAESSPGAAKIAEFAALWPQDGKHRLEGVVDKPKVAARTIAHYDEKLNITATTVKLAGDAECDETTCTEHAQITHEIAGAGAWTYRERVVAKRDEKTQHWRVVWKPSTFHPDLTKASTLVARRSLPPRAPILGRTGEALTPLRKIVRIGLVPRKVKPQQTYVELAQLLSIDVGSLRDRVEAAQPDWFVSVIDLRRADYRPIRKKLLQVPGIIIDSGERALAPTASWARAVLGVVGPATKETLASAGTYALPTDEVGDGGLQEAFQERLAGTPGLTILVKEKSTGDVLSKAVDRPPKSGQPLQTTLDVDAQTAAESALQSAEKPTSVVLVKASTGEILAAANGPGVTSYNTAFRARVAPGSTFKTVTAAALLKNRVVQPDSRTQCPNSITIAGKEFHNFADDLPVATFADAFAWSCNTAFVSYADDLTGEELADMAHRFGLGSDWDLGLPAFSGSVPAESGQVARAAAMIGQGKVQASPLAMAMVAAAVDSGVARTPTLLPGLAPGKRLDALPQTLVTELQTLMRRVVTDGTGTVLDLPDRTVYAKTGTAEFAAKGGTGTNTNAWMIGYAGDVAFAVFVQGGESGSHDAGPVVRDIVENLPKRLFR